MAKKVTQRDVDKAELSFIIKQRQSYAVADSPGFRELVALGVPSLLKPMCRQTVSKRIQELRTGMEKNLKEKLSSVEYVATTADCWTKNKKSFLGMYRINYAKNHTMPQF